MAAECLPSELRTGAARTRTTTEGGSSRSKRENYLPVIITSLIKTLVTAVETPCIRIPIHWSRSVAFKARFFVLF